MSFLQGVSYFPQPPQFPQTVLSKKERQSDLQTVPLIHELDKFRAHTPLVIKVKERNPSHEYPSVTDRVGVCRSGTRVSWSRKTQVQQKHDKPT